jgi:hypothetical protein
MLNRILKLLIVSVAIYLVASLWVSLDPRRYFDFFVAETQGNVTRSDVFVVKRPSGKHKIDVPVWHFAARYNVDGKAYITNEFSPDQEFWREQAKSMQSIHPVDSRITIRYIAPRPEKAWVVQASPPYKQFASSFFYGVMALAFYTLLGIRDKRVGCDPIAPRT